MKYCSLQDQLQWNGSEYTYLSFTAKTKCANNRKMKSRIFVNCECFVKEREVILLHLLFSFYTWVGCYFFIFFKKNLIFYRKILFLVLKVWGTRLHPNYRISLLKSPIHIFDEVMAVPAFM
jgi:hypothetical protein